MSGILGIGRRKQHVVRVYGRDAFLIWVNPILSALAASLGFRVGLHSDAEVLDRVQKDVLSMERQGYRVVTSEELELPVSPLRHGRATYYRITYELNGAGPAPR
jgi:hypothetical protein